MREFKYDVIQLINGIKDRPCLWDKTIDNYKDRVERRSAWEEIFNLLDDKYEDMTPEGKRLTGEQVLNKWTNIRDTFVKSLKVKMGKPKKKYMYYNNLKFLLKVTPEEGVEHNDYSYETYEFETSEVAHNMKQEVEIQMPESETSYSPRKRLKRSDIDDTILDVVETINHKRKSKRNEFEDYSVSDHSYSSKEKTKQFSPQLKKKRHTKKNSKREKVARDDDSINNDINFVEVDESDNTDSPRVMNEDEAFFASLLPTVVRYSEDERLEFRIEVLGIMKQIKDKRLGIV